MKDLTKRQKEVLTLVGQGLTNSQIAEKLNITTHTVKAHLCILYENFSCGSKVSLVVKALGAGVISLNDFAE